MRMKSNPPFVPGSGMGSPGVSGAAYARKAKAASKQPALTADRIFLKPVTFIFDIIIPFLVTRFILQAVPKD